MTINTYVVGTVVRLSAAFVSGTVAIDPTTITLLIEDPLRVSTSYSGAAITRDAAGVYHCDYTTTAEGRHRYRWIGTGSVSAGEGQFDVVTALSLP